MYLHRCFRASESPLNHQTLILPQYSLLVGVTCNKRVTFNSSIPLTATTLAQTMTYLTNVEATQCVRDAEVEGSNPFAPTLCNSLWRQWIRANSPNPFFVELPAVIPSVIPFLCVWVTCASGIGTCFPKTANRLSSCSGLSDRQLVNCS